MKDIDEKENFLNFNLVLFNKFFHLSINSKKYFKFLTNFYLSIYNFIE